MSDYCIECGRAFPECHHIVFRSQAKFMENADINKLPLCSVDHKGNNGPHLNHKTDIRYKIELQKKLFQLFGKKELYLFSEIKNLLIISEKDARILVKTLKFHSEGYAKLDIIIRCMGGRLYAE